MKRDKFGRLSLHFFLLGLSALLIHFFTRWGLFVADRLSMFAYGYPIYWLKPSLVSSMAYDVQPFGVLANLGTNFLFFEIFYLLLRKRIEPLMSYKGLLISTGAVFLLFSTALIVVPDHFWIVNEPLLSFEWQYQNSGFMFGFERPFGPRE